MERASVQYALVRGPGERTWEDWGDCAWYMEVDERLSVVRELQIYENGNVLSYDTVYSEDEHGGLGNMPLEWLASDDPDEELGEDYSYTKLSREEFETKWLSVSPMNR